MVIGSCLLVYTKQLLDRPIFQSERVGKEAEKLKIIKVLLTWGYDRSGISFNNLACNIFYCDGYKTKGVAGNVDSRGCC